MTPVISYALYGLIAAFGAWTWWGSRNLSKRIDADRPAIERRERIKFLTVVAEAPTGVSANRRKAKDELEELLYEEGYGVPEDER